MASPASSSDQSITSAPFGLRNGAPIPRKFVRIPKDQQALLDHQGSWISAPKDHPQQNPARVPPKVLEQIKYFHTSRTLPPPAQKPKALLSSGPTATTSVSENAPNDEQEDGGKSDSEPEVPVSSWPESPPRPPREVELQETPSPAPSIRSQVMTERQSSATRISQSPPPQTRSSPQMRSSPPVISATKRKPSPTTRLKRCQIEAFPSSSAGVEEELETAIPGALCEATPPINRTAARLAAVSQAVTSPPCGQGSMVPSTYKDVKSPEKAEGPVNKKRRFKAIPATEFDANSQEVVEKGHSAKTTPQSIIPLFLPPQGIQKTSSESAIASTPLVAGARPDLGILKVVKDTPSLSKTVDPSHEANETSYPDPRPSGAHVRPSIESGGNVKTSALLGPREALSEDAGWNSSKLEVRRQEVISHLNEEWKRHGLDWIPPAFQHLRPTLTVHSLEVLQDITRQASKNGIPLARLWSEPDGLLFQAAMNLAKGKLVFSQELAEISLSFFEAEDSRLAKTRGPGSSGEARQATARGSSRPASPHGAASNIAPVNPSPPTSPSAMQGLQPTASPQALLDSLYQSVETPRPPQAMLAKPSFAQGPLEAFRQAYPSFSGSVGDFVKACFTIKDLRRKRLLPKWLYDDFIRAFVGGFVPYIESLDDDEEPLSAYQWYVEYVDRPAFQGGVVTRENLYQVFKIYNTEFKSARESLLESTTPFPEATQRRVSEQSAALKPSIGPDTPIAQKANPTPRPRIETVRTSGSTPSKATPASRYSSPDEQFILSKTNGGGRVDEQRTTEAHTRNTSPIASDLPPTNREKDKQRMANKEIISLRNAPASAPTIQRHTNALQDDEDVAFISSNPRPRMANPTKKGLIRTESNNTSTTPFAEKEPLNPLLSGLSTPKASKPTRDSIIAETPPRKTAGPAKWTTQHPAVRRSLPASFSDARPPPASMPPKASGLVTSPAASPLPSSTPNNTLPNFFQESRVKKPKQKTERTEKEGRKVALAKMQRMLREGRYAPPSSTMPPRS
ncbi:hypothetical protein CORC01_13934 [Colletotrichum orchidophilum]|uniref:Uncharacterized protein n=1 Tax=Colletotrichum orchidophilum TaxID=1209926 RepID=A0A1G4AP06_9PEZI|nr:uncharacterized protein CORC01_13934 [Colletotrichum orchidophilum]OHE90762.1 hypothetical protein CORC01_13934 [Colletotrichum orchidophilum]